MSVGVCVINRNGIALAADSAGTFTGSDMFYNSINKVFPLSSKYAYGAVTYGVLAVQGVPVEQLLKEFGNYLDSKGCINDFFEIVPRFQEYIESNHKYYNFDDSEKTYCEWLINTLVTDYGGKIKSVVSLDDVENKIDEILLELNTYITKHLKVENYDVSQYIMNDYLTRYEHELNNIVPELNNYPTKKEKFWELICQYFNLSIKKDDESKTGILFAGYGKNDAFPKYIHVETYLVIGGMLKMKVVESYTEYERGSKILPLAQDEIILTFCKGISDSFKNFIPEKIEDIINNKIDNLKEDFSEEQKNTIKNSLKECKQEITNAINIKSRNENVDPLLRSVTLIPLSEMAFLAENLVNITSLRRTYVLDGNQQTVGGPTDVAIISKTDGFCWIKKKDNKLFG